ncbi:MAG: hypothetical protein H7061_14545 [Bdellovibrionaceae bacterium]|nr:hypothetical protein [Bdellovibrio sp.]
MTHELNFDNNTYKMQPYDLSKNIFSSKVSAFDLNVLWTRFESLDKFDLKKECKQGEIFKLLLQTKATEACLKKDGQVTFVTQLFSSVEYFNIHHFQFPQGTNKEKVLNFFSKVKYEQKK